MNPVFFNRRERRSIFSFALFFLFFALPVVTAVKVKSTGDSYPLIFTGLLSNSRAQNVQSEIILPLKEETFEGVFDELYYYRQPQTRAAVEWFYADVAGSREVSLAILSAADENDIEPSLAFAIAHTESQFKIHARHQNENGTIDRGVFQLNSNSFPQLKEEDFFNPKISASYGLKHLKLCLKSGNSVESAVAMYNAGIAKVSGNHIPKTTKLYITKVLRYKAHLEETFQSEIVNAFKKDDLYLCEKQARNEDHL